VSERVRERERETRASIRRHGRDKTDIVQHTYTYTYTYSITAQQQRNQSIDRLYWFSLDGDYSVEEV